MNLAHYSRNITSKHGEDGVIEYLVNKYGSERSSKKTFVNIVDFSKSQHQSAVRNLVVKKGFTTAAASMDSVDLIKTGTIQSIQQLAKHCITHNHIDVLNISHGYNDFWLLKSFIENCKPEHVPNIIACIYNQYIPLNKSITVPFSKNPIQRNGYDTCSILALHNLLTEYFFIGCTDNKVVYFVHQSRVAENYRYITSNLTSSIDFWDTVKELFWVQVKNKTKPK